MKATIKVATSLKFRVRDFELVEESNGLEMEVDVEDEADLDKQITKWQRYIHKKVIDSAFKAANLYLEERKDLEEE